MLLVAVVFLMGLFRTMLSPERVRSYMEGRSHGLGYLLTVILGAVTLFCSCSSVPLFIGFLEGDTAVVEPDGSLAGRAAYAWGEVRSIVGRIWLYVLVAIGIGAALHGYVPEELFARMPRRTIHSPFPWPS